MTPQEFITKWGPGGPASGLNEKQGAQAHFIDLCQMLGVPTPGSDLDYTFEQDTLILGSARGYADVFMRDHFAWENKAPGRNLDDALKQLLGYSLALYNPPLLVVSDRLIIRIHTQFNGHPSEVHTVALHELDQPAKQALLRRLWTNPESFRPKKTSRDITEAAAKSFSTLADGLRNRGPNRDADPQGWQANADKVAHFLTQCLFCFFAEDVGLLPGRMFEALVGNKMLTSDRLTQGLKNLFVTMGSGGMYGSDDIPWFNGGLFKKVNVPALSIMEMTELRNAAALNWSAIDVSIFGTLFERGLDPSKRSQLGAHYTDPATIMRIVEPVLVRPLMQRWEIVAQEMGKLLAVSKRKKGAAYTAGGRRMKATAGDASFQKAERLFHNWLHDLKNYRVLDPACGSGNFLFLGLKALKDIEHKSHLDAVARGLDREADLVTGPHNVLGIELNEYAAELARVTVWIGELQWRIEHGYEFKTNPVLEPLDHIECRDALLTFEGEHALEAQWPRSNVVIGNPPFVGDKKMRAELGDEYTTILRKTYEGRVPGGADLVCYWFEKARAALKLSQLDAAGLVATNVITRGSNRKVLDQVARISKIYDVWDDQPWVNEGATLRVSLICFGEKSQSSFVNGEKVSQIFSDLKPQKIESLNVADFTTAKPLKENKDSTYFGLCLAGPFKIPASTAAHWLKLPNPNGRPNSDVLRPIFNGSDIAGAWCGNWVIDFGAVMGVDEAALYEQPFEYVVKHVMPARLKNNRSGRATYWWRHGETRPGLRGKLVLLNRYIATIETAKHRFFFFMPVEFAAEHSLIVIPRSDDMTFGMLESRCHNLWTMCMGSPYGNHPSARRYNATRTFEPFPFPEGLTPADTAHQRSEAITGDVLIPADLSAPAARRYATEIASAAKKLNDLRDLWLNPPEWTERVPEVVPLGMKTSPYPDRIVPKVGFENQMAERTFTKLYNLRPAWLDAAHKTLDLAVAAAYGWNDYTASMTDEEILKRLLALNLQRAGR